MEFRRKVVKVTAKSFEIRLQRTEKMFLHEIWNNRKNLNVEKKPHLLVFDTTSWNHQLKKPYKTEMSVTKVEQKFQRSGCLSVFWYLAEKFSQQTSINGIAPLFNESKGKLQRCLWFLSFLLALLMLIYVSLELASRYTNKQFQSVIDSTKYPVYKVPFPELVICNQNRLNWDRLSEAQERFLLRSHRTSEHELLFAKIIAHYDTLSFGNFHRFASLANMSLDPLNYINFTTVAHVMTWRCEELFADCVWLDQGVDCCDIFFPRNSQLGACLAFNSIASPQGRLKQLFEDIWPWRSGKSGPSTGLKVRVMLNPLLHSPYSINEKGVTMMIVEPSVWFSFPIEVAVDTKTSVSIDAIKHFYDNLTRDIPTRQRECIFQDEHGSADYKTLTGYTYMFENCQAECQQQYLLQFCNCTLDLFYPTGPYKPCKLVDLPCLAQYNDRMLYFEQRGEHEYVHPNITGMQCNCLLNCYSLTYINNVQSTVIKEQERVPNNSYILLDFFWRQDTILVFKTSIRFTWVDLIASFGGIAGLCLGCSLISLVELVYFFMIDMPKSFCQEYEDSKRSKKLKAKFSKLLLHKISPDIKLHY